MKLQEPGLNRNALTLTEVLIAIAIVGLLAVVILPSIVRSRARSSRVGCVNSLKEIGLAFRIWGQDVGDRYSTRVSVQEGGAKELIETGGVWSVFVVMSNQLSSPRL